MQNCKFSKRGVAIFTLVITKSRCNFLNLNDISFFILNVIAFKFNSFINKQVVLFSILINRVFDLLVIFT